LEAKAQKEYIISKVEDELNAINLQINTELFSIKSHKNWDN
jgi:hypothetical protein